MAKQHEPDGESLDFNAKDHVSGFTDAQCGSLSSTGWLNFKPWGPHITNGDNNVSPEKQKLNIYKNVSLEK